ncbi:MAG: chitobiase/beta-hexosaminidase C-terminal domain-containing protein [Spirochaetia bacterium]|nr:chitobiase/beta-hexosaminidase C-terminal domain-containing protein [Spirochaetia bacterium]
MPITKKLESGIHPYRLLFVLSVVFLVLAGCQEPDPYGELQFGLDEGTSKSITPGSSAKVTQVSFWGEETNSSKTLSKQTLVLGEKNTVSSIPVGTWDFHVEGMNSDGTVITEQADADAEVKSGATSSISFTLHYLTSDTGTYSIGISWPEDLSSTFTKVEASLGDSWYEGTASGGSATVSGSAAAGDYMVGVRFTNPSGTQLTFSGMDMVNVFTGLESSGTISFEDADFTKAAQPTISTGDVTGGKQVTMATDTAEAAIYYTTDGTDPATSSTRESYTAPFTLAESKTVEAVAVKADLLDSEGASQVVTVSAVATPTFSPAGGTTFTSTQTVTMTSTSGATIYYTTDGTTPTTSSSHITSGGSITLSATTTVKAMAVKSGMTDSSIGTSGTYTLKITYTVGETGPAGGCVFYDKGSYSDGWRYLEAAPADEDGIFRWGGYGTYINGTETSVGSGESNTERIVSMFGDQEPYQNCTDYAAKVCSEKVYNGYNDWFLPSRGELLLIWHQLYTQGLGGEFVSDGTCYYWSSSEYDKFAASSDYMETNHIYNINKTSGAHIRAIRSF